ncbi:hypothetical protein N2W54_000942 [Lotmaria passim]
MDAECTLQLHYSPLTAAWTSEASLRVAAELLGYRDDTAAPSEPLSTRLQLLLYVSCFHRLREVIIEEELEGSALDTSDSSHAGDGERTQTPPGEEESGGAACAASTPTASPQEGQRERQRVRTPVSRYFWLPCPHPIAHAKAASKSRSSSPPQGSSTAAAEPAAAGTLSALLNTEKTAEETPQPLFSTLLSAIPSSAVLGSNEEGDEEDDDDDAADGDSLVLRFDSLSTSSSTVLQEGGCADAQNDHRTASATLPDILLHTEANRPASSGPAAVVPVQAETEVGRVLAAPADEADNGAAVATAAVSPPPPPRPRPRLLLLRPGSAREGMTTSSTAAVAPSCEAPLFSSTTSVVPGHRVLNIGAATVKPAQQEQLPQSSPSPSLPLPVAPLTDASPLSSPPTTSAPQTSASARGRELQEPSAPPVSQKATPWCPYIFAFRYKSVQSTATDATTTPEEGGRGGCGASQAALPLPWRPRRLVAVHFIFADIATGEGAASSSSDPSLSVTAQNSREGHTGGQTQHSTSPFWSRASVASCGRLKEFVAAPFHVDHTYSSGGGGGCCCCCPSGYAIVVGDASLQTCWLCPLVACVEGTAWCGGADIDANMEGSSLKAGPLTDVWVSAVSASVDLLRNASGDTASFKEPPQQHPGMKREPQTEDDCFVDTARAVPREGSRSEASSALLCLHFSPAPLSQLVCVFATPPLLCSAKENEVKEDEAPRGLPAHSIQWPSLSVSGLCWVGSRITADCVVLQTSSLEASAALSPLPGAPKIKVRRIRCVSLQSDSHLVDALYTFYLQVEALFATALGAAKALFPAEDFANASTTEEAMVPQVVLTRVTPASLSLRGGAVGTANGIVLVEETVRAADLAATLAVSSRCASVARCGCGTAVLRARVAVTAAIVQHLLWRICLSAVRGLERGGDSVGKSDGCCSRTAADVRELTLRVGCVARALALQWVCGGGALAHHSGADTVLQLLAEERRILTSACAVGQLIRANEGQSSEGGRNSSTEAALGVLQGFRQQYTTASLAALSWLGYDTASVRLMRSRSMATAGSLAAQQRLCLWALRPIESYGKHSALSAESLDLLRMHRYSDTPRCLSKFSQLCSDACADVDPTGERKRWLKGSVDVRIEHAASFNALHIDLDWHVTSPCSPTDLDFVTGTKNSVTVELPFLLLVFVIEQEDEKISTEEEPVDMPDDQDDDHNTRSTRGSNACRVRLYQATSFSWHLPVQSCSCVHEKGERLTLSVMHALDLVARRPDAFADFNVQASAAAGSGGSGISEGNEGSTQWKQGRKLQTATRRRRQRSAKDVNAGAGASAVARVPLGAKTSTTRSEVGHGGGGRQRRGLVVPARKRQRTQHSIDDDGDNSSISGAGSSAEDASDPAQGDTSDSDGDHGEDEDEDEDDAIKDDNDDGTLLLNLGSGSGRCRGDKSAGAAATPTATRRRKAAGVRSTESFSALDTARVLPLVVFRRDCAAPLVDVEVRQTSLLAAQLRAAGYSSDAALPSADDSDDSEERRTARNPSATAALCGLLSHLVGFATVHAAAANAVAQLRQRQAYTSLLSLSTASSTPSAAASALTEPSVLCAYGELLRGILSGLTDTTEVSAELRQLVSTSAVLADTLSAAAVMTSVRMALAEYACQDAACRARALAFEMEAEANDTLSTGVTTSSATSVRTKKNCGRGKQQLQQQQQRKQREAKERSMEEVKLAWTVAPDVMHDFSSVLFTSVLRFFCRTRCSVLKRLLSDRKGVLVELEASAYSGSFLFPPHNASICSLQDGIGVLRSCGSPWGTTVAADLNLPPSQLQTAASPLRNASSTPVLRLQLRSTAAAPQPMAAPLARTPLLASLDRSLSLSQLRTLAAARLGFSAGLASEQNTNVFGGETLKESTNSDRSSSSSSASLDILNASASALLTNATDARPAPAFITTAAASLGLAIVQLSCDDVTEKQ